MSAPAPAAAPGAQGAGGGNPPAHQSSTCLGRMWNYIKQEAPNIGKKTIVVAIKMALLFTAFMLSTVCLGLSAMAAGPVGMLLLGLPLTVGIVMGSKLVSDAAIHALGLEKYNPFLFI